MELLKAAIQRRKAAILRRRATPTRSRTRAAPATNPRRRATPTRAAPARRRSTRAAAPATTTRRRATPGYALPTLFGQGPSGPMGGGGCRLVKEGNGEVCYRLGKHNEYIMIEWKDLSPSLRRRASIQRGYNRPSPPTMTKRQLAELLAKKYSRDLRGSSKKQYIDTLMHQPRSELIKMANHAIST